MTTTEIGSLKLAMNKEGFLIEAKAEQILMKRGFDTQTNPPTVSDDLRGDIDVFSDPSPSNGLFNSIFVIQCKGGSKDNVLTLWADSKKFIKGKPGGYPGIYVPYRMVDQLSYSNGLFSYYCPNPCHEKSVYVSETTEKTPLAFRYCYSGDFRNANTPNKKAPREDDKNNLFKGIKQLTIAMPSLETKISQIECSRNSDFPLRVIPLIVTNTKIFVRESDEATGKLIEVDWAICEIGKIPRASNRTGIQYVYIVTIDKLDFFIDKFA